MCGSFKIDFLLEEHSIKTMMGLTKSIMINMSVVRVHDIITHSFWMKMNHKWKRSCSQSLLMH